MPRGRERDGVSVVTQPFPLKTQGNVKDVLEGNLPSLCHRCVYTGQCWESLALSLRLTCPNVSHLLHSYGVGGRMSIQAPPAASHTFPGLLRKLQGGVTSLTSIFNTH